MTNDRLQCGGALILEGREGIDNVIIGSAVRFPRCAMQKERPHCEKCVEIAHDGCGGSAPWWPKIDRKKRSRARFCPFSAPNSPGNQKVDNVIGNILDIALLNSPMHRAITSHR